MSKVCEICNKSTTFGKNIRHKHADKWRNRAPKTSRKWKPNLRTAKVKIDGKVKKVKLCMKCYKTLAKKGKLA
jgi:large subunit ribosomal protein L28